MKAISQFLKEVKNEMTKIVWPSRADFSSALVVTLLVVFFFSVYIGVLDRLISLAINWVFARTV
jgi:preprotein translocase subunit SecE